MEILKVKSSSDPKSVAGAISNMFAEGAQEVELHAVGAGALNQAIKSIIIARSYVSTSALDLYVVPGFVTINIEGEERTGIKLIIKK